jgi:hypothetical protein
MSAAIDRAQLARILGMLGSAHDGEVLDAAKLATRLIGEAGATWPQILEPDPVIKDAIRPLLAENQELRAAVEQSQRKSQPPMAQSFDPDDPNQMFALCTLWAKRLTPWEQEFIASLPQYPRLSPKQHAVLRRLAEKCDRLAQEAAR